MNVNLNDDGYTIIKGAITSGLCDQINEDFRDYVEHHREYADKFKLDTGNHSRLCNMHMISAAAKAATFPIRLCQFWIIFLQKKHSLQPHSTLNNPQLRQCIEMYLFLTPSRVIFLLESGWHSRM